jgi:hypothetical protein
LRDPGPAAIEVRLREAYDQLAPLPERAGHLGIAVPRLAAIANRGFARTRHPFDEVGARRTKDELEAVAEAVEAHDADGLQAALATLHAPAIAALARVGVVRHLAPHLHDLAGRARTACKAVEKAPPLPSPPGGRPRDNLAYVVASCVIDDYQKLTGEVLRSAGIERHDGLGKLMADVFKLLGLSANPRAVIARALSENRKL